MTEAARTSYPTLARVEARHPNTEARPATIEELTFALDEIDRLRIIRDLVMPGN